MFLTNFAGNKNWKTEKKLEAISFITFWGFLIFYQISLSQQVKRFGIMTYKHGMYELYVRIKSIWSFFSFVFQNDKENFSLDITVFDKFNC